MAVVWAETAIFCQDNAFAGASVTYTATSIGTAAADRIVVVNFGCKTNNAGPSLSCTIGGVTATQACTTTGQTLGASFYLNVTSGTTATIVATTSAGSIGLIGLSVGTITGAGASGTPNTTAIKANAFSDPLVATSALTINTGGIGVVALSGWQASALTWNVGSQDARATVSTTAQHAVGNITATGSQTPSLSDSFGAQGALLTATSWTAASTQNPFLNYDWPNPPGPLRDDPWPG